MKNRLYSTVMAERTSPTVIKENYERTLQLAFEIIKKEQHQRGYRFDPGDPDNTDLAQSLLGMESVVKLLKAIPFNKEIYRPVLEGELGELKRSLFLDVNKRRFMSYELMETRGLNESPTFETAAHTDERSPEVHADEILDYLEGKLSSESFQFLEKLILNTEMEWSDAIFRLIDREPDELELKIKRIREFYPDGKLRLDKDIDVSQALDESVIVRLYKNVYLGIVKSFPIYFLQYESRRRSAILTRFLVQTILKTSPRAILEKNETDVFSETGLSNVLRYFNYSLNKVILNAFPDEVQPWENSRVLEGYWDKKENRIKATRWLVEEKLGIPAPALPRAIQEGLLTKKSFTEYQLSYLFNQFYNSVSKAIGEAYPELKPWELASVPRNYWNGMSGLAKAKQAVQWVIEKEGLDLGEIPQKIKTKELDRKTFSRYGLSTMFEKVFNKNMFQALEAAYPGRFQRWEVGKVTGGFWDDLSNAYRAVDWVRKNEGLEDSRVYEEYKKGKLTATLFHKYNLGSMIRFVFQNNILKIFHPQIVKVRNEKIKEEIKLLNEIDRRIRQISGHITIWERLLYGWFLKDVKRTSEYNIRKYKQMRRRIKRRLLEV